MVSAIAKSGLAADFPPAPEDVPVDQPWKNLFPSARTWGGDAADVGSWDEEDAVWRCPDCHHELFGGVCTGCGRIFRALLNALDDDWSGDEGDDVDFGVDPRVHVGGIRHVLLNALLPDGLDDGLEDTDEEYLGNGSIRDMSGSEGSYESDFVVDDDEPVGGGPGPRRGGRAARVVEISSGEEEDDDVVEVQQAASRASRGRRSMPVVISDSEDERHSVGSGGETEPDELNR